MTRLEQLANQVACLSNASMQELARILVKDYPTRADMLESAVGVEFVDQENMDHDCGI
jgi:hypothetical protein